MAAASWRSFVRGGAVASLVATVMASGLAVVPVHAVSGVGRTVGTSAAQATLAAAGPTTVSGDILSDQTWTLAESPYVLSSSVYVRSGATLTIDPGVVVKFSPTGGTVNTGGLRVVHGRLVARGTGASPIVFTSLYDDTVGGDTDGGAGVPQAGDWATISIGAPNAATAAETAPSVIANASIRYGGEGGSTACNTGEAISVGALGRLRVTKSEIFRAYAAGIASAALDPGIGSLSVSNVGVSESGCGFFPRAGTFTNNIVDQTVGQSFWANMPTDVTMSGNWFVNVGDSRASPTPPNTETFDFRNNAIPNGMASFPRNQMPVDLSHNWWGPNPTMPGSCHAPGDREVPAVDLVIWTAASGCPWADPVHGAYFTQVLPFASQPPVPQVGPGADSSAPASVPWEQMLGGLGGSEYAYPAQGSMADPVATATGAYVEERVDATVPAAGLGLAAARTYNSADPAVGWLGRGWHFGYEAWLDIAADESVVVLHAEDGQQVRYDRQPDGSYRGGPGVTAKLSHDGDGWLVGTRAQLERRFGPSGRLLSMTDANDNTVWLGYDVDGNLESAASAGRLLAFEHNPAGRIAKVTLEDGRYVGYGYTDGMLTSVRDLAGRSTTYAYDAQGRLATKTDAAGHQVMRLAYDATSGRVSDQWDALDKHTSFGWDPVTGVATMTDPRGKVWTDRYDGNLIMARIAPDGATTSYTYDADLQLIETDGPRGVHNEFSYNPAGDLISTSTPTGTVTTVYDQRHRPIESINARGTRVAYEYDAADNLTRIIRPEPGTPAGTLEESFTYSDRGLLLTSTDARGKTVTHTYTGAGDLASSTAPSGAKSTFSYDLTGRLIGSVDPRGNEPGADPATYTTSYSYADDDQPLEVIDPLGRATRYTYDAVGRTKSVIDAKDRATTYTYDDAGHVTAVQGPDPAIPATTYEYDANGNLTKETDTAGRVTSYTYDAVNRMAQGTTPLGAYTYGYDKAGNLTKVTDPTAKSTAMVYDSANRLITIDYPSGSDVTYRYDANGNRTTMTDGAGTVTYGYDKLDRLLIVTRGSSVFRFGYDRVGAITTMTYPDGTAYEYGYDDNHRLDTVTQAGSTLADYAYDPAGLPATVTRGNTTSSTYSHDSAGQLIRILDQAVVGDPLLDESYTYDSTGNLTAIDGPNGQRTFTYDELDRLTAACYDTTSCDGATDFVRWTYDAASNRTSETRPAGTTNYQYAANTGLLTSTTGPAGTTTFEYNALGQLTKRTAPGGAISTSTYLPSGRPATETAGGATTSYAYDGDGRRLTSTLGSQVTRFTWNPASYQLAAETAGDGTLLRRYAYGLGPIGVARPGQSGLDYYHLDRHGSVRGVTNQAAAVQWRQEWEPYGVPKTVTQVDPAAQPNPIGWTGQYGDPSGLTHLRARQYDPTLGRFMAPDQAAAMTFSATGTYANANPLTYVDPMGLWSVSGVWNGIAAGAAVVAPVAGVVAPFTGPLAPVVGGVALAAGAITAVDAAYNAYQVCTGAEKGSCAGEIATGAISIVAGGASAAALKVGMAARGAATTAARACSFDGATTVLMADGSLKAIEDVEVGDLVIATDPETGEQVAKRVERVFVHDDTVVDLVVDGDVIATTEDHAFWSVTDQRFERADELEEGELVLGADGRTVTVSGLKIGTVREEPAYNLSVEGIHTYHVGEGQILVHNTCDLFAGGSLSGRSIIGVRSTLLSSGFTQGLARNKKGYLFSDGTGDEVRIMRKAGGWEARVQTAGGNYLDEFGNGALDRESAHGIWLVSR